MPTKPLPSSPNIEHLKYQAKDLLKDRRAGNLQACQRIREFHPRFKGMADSAIRAATFTLSDARLAIAREYGFSSWARLGAHVTKAGRSELDLPHHERIEDQLFRKAVDLLDGGDVDALRDHLKAHPELIRQRVVFEGGNYFRNPTLLEFVAGGGGEGDVLIFILCGAAKTFLFKDIEHSHLAVRGSGREAQRYDHSRSAGQARRVEKPRLRFFATFEPETRTGACPACHNRLAK